MAADRYAHTVRRQRCFKSLPKAKGAAHIKVDIAGKTILLYIKIILCLNWEEKYGRHSSFF